MAALLRWGAVAVGGLVAASALALGFLFYDFDAPGPSGGPVTVVVPKGSGVGAIGQLLARHGVLRRAWVFQAGVRLSGATAALRAGEYEFPGAVSARGVVDILRSGKTVVRKLTAPEGITSPQIAALVRAAAGLEGEIGPVPPEGTLLPDTYYYSWGDRRGDMLRRMGRAMDEAVDRLWRERAPGLPIARPTDAVVLASIVEKETGKPEERALIAGVFYNRLRRGMPLQSDPTVAYGLALAAGGADGNLGRALARRDLEMPGPYNTYLNRGLPPGPICNPGLAALAAALRPAPTDALYFVADGNGGHVFANTLAEHNRNVRRWRKLQDAAREGRDGSTAPGAAAP